MKVVWRESEGCWVRRTFWHKRADEDWYEIGFDSFHQFLRFGLLEGEGLAEHVREVARPVGGNILDAHWSLLGWKFTYEDFEHA